MILQWNLSGKLKTLSCKTGVGVAMGNKSEVSSITAESVRDLADSVRRCKNDLKSYNKSFEEKKAELYSKD